MRIPVLSAPAWKNWARGTPCHRGDYRACPYYLDLNALDTLDGANLGELDDNDVAVLINEGY